MADPGEPVSKPLTPMAAEAKEKFTAAGRDAIPLMLELVWKKHETHYGAVPSCFPNGMWNSRSRFSSSRWSLRELGPIGGSRRRSAALANGRRRICWRLFPRRTRARAGLVASLGFGGDLKTVDELRNRLKEDPTRPSRNTRPVLWLREAVRDPAARSVRSQAHDPSASRARPWRRQVQRYAEVLRRVATTGEPHPSQ